MLTGKQRSYLKGKGNRLEPIIHIGKEGISQAVLKQLEEALTSHELVKGRVLNNSLVEAEEAAHNLAAGTKAHVVQVIGNVFLLYRANPEEPRYKLP